MISEIFFFKKRTIKFVVIREKYQLQILISD
jgi:hypothetical protein